MQGDWGSEEDQWRDLWPSEALPPDQLPAVVAARARGWFLSPEAPMWSFLPAVWPPTDRGWVPDRSLQIVRMRCEGAPETVIPFSAWDYAQYERDINEILVSAGVLPRPFGRLWLLRPPPGFSDLDSAVDALAAGADTHGVPFMCCPEFVTWTRATLDTWFVGTA